MKMKQNEDTVMLSNRTSPYKIYVCDLQITPLNLHIEDRIYLYCVDVQIQLDN